MLALPDGQDRDTQGHHPDADQQGRVERLAVQPGPPSAAPTMPMPAQIA